MHTATSMRTLCKPNRFMSFSPNQKKSPRMRRCMGAARAYRFFGAARPRFALSGAREKSADEKIDSGFECGLIADHRGIRRPVAMSRKPDDGFEDQTRGRGRMWQRPKSAGCDPRFQIARELRDEGTAALDVKELSQLGQVNRRSLNQIQSAPQTGDRRVVLVKDRLQLGARIGD